MDWVSLVGAAGIGAILIKIIDIVWLQKALEKSEHKKWLRNQKLAVFTELSELLLSIGISKKHNIDNNPYEFYAVASKSLLLIENEELQKQINTFIVDWDKLINEKLTETKSDELYAKLTKKSKVIVNELHKDLKL